MGIGVRTHEMIVSSFVFSIFLFSKKWCIVSTFCLTSSVENDILQKWRSPLGYTLRYHRFKILNKKDTVPGQICLINLQFLPHDIIFRRNK